MSIESYWVEEGVLLAGRYPSAETLPELLAVGATLFVDLTHAADRQPPYEHLLPEGVRRVNVPFADFGAGTVESVREALDAIDAEIERGGIPYVHCRFGCGRTGTVIGCRLVRHGRPPEEALAAIRELSGHDCPESGAQRAMVRGWRLEQ